jgi:hypothetical protein
MKISAKVKLFEQLITDLTIIMRMILKTSLESPVPGQEKPVAWQGLNNRGPCDRVLKSELQIKVL